MSHENTTLLTIEEAVMYSPTDEHLAGESLSAYIRPQEESMFNLRFGWGFYEKLLADRYEYVLRADGDPADDSNGKRFYYYENPATVTFVAGDFVLFGDIVYKALRDITAPNIGASNTDYYQRADRFKTECLQRLWTRYLRVILATAVVRSSVVSRTFKDTQRGALKQYDEGKSRALTIGEVSFLKLEHLGDIEDNILNMERYIKRESNTGCFADYGKLESSSANTCNPDGSINQGIGSDGFTKPDQAARRMANHGFSL